MPSTCPYCGIGFHGWGEYHEHLKTHQHKEVKPVNHTGRSKAQIVSEAEETWLHPYLIGSVPLVHSVDCRCNVCLNARLDAIIAEQEAALNLNTEE